jgi:hypothetical protein
VLSLYARAAQRELIARDQPLVVGEEGVVSGCSGKHALGQTEHDRKVKVEPDTHADRGDENALAHPPDAPEVGVEFKFKGSGEDVEPNGTFNPIEAGQSVQGDFDALGCPLLG